MIHLVLGFKWAPILYLWKSTAVPQHCRMKQAVAGVFNIALCMADLGYSNKSRVPVATSHSE